MVMQRRLLQCQSFIAQQALREAIQKPRTLPSFSPHRRRLHSPSPPAAASPSLSSRLLWRSSASLLPMSTAAAARTVVARWMAARGSGSLELFSLQRKRSAGSRFSELLLRIMPWTRRLPSPDGVVVMIIGVNVTVFMLWHLVDPAFMQRHFMISLDNFKSGRLHTLLTSAFSHMQSGHLFNNMFGYFFFGSSIANMFGTAFLLKLYIAGALTGSAFFLIEQAFRAPRELASAGWDSSRASTLGATAAVNATILLHVFLYPKSKVYVYFVLPIPAALLGAAYIGADLWSVNKGQGAGSAHLGGALVAALMWARIRKGWI